MKSAVKSAPELSQDTLRVVGRETVSESDLARTARAFLKSLGEDNNHAVISEDTPDTVIEVTDGDIALLSVAYTESYLADHQERLLAQQKRGDVPLRISQAGWAVVKAAAGFKGADSVELWYAAAGVRCGSETDYNEHRLRLAAVPPGGERAARAYAILILLSNGVTSLPRRKQ